jgi:Gluconate 2-dehydrogenase subunit 3
LLARTGRAASILAEIATEDRMDRRAALRVLGTAASLPLLAPDVQKLVREARVRFASQGPRTLNPHQDATVSAMADRIIPATDTPGAAAAKVNEFADVMLTDWMDTADKDRFLAGLADVDQRCRAMFSKDFVDLSPADQDRFLIVLDEEVARLRDAKQDPSRHVFHQMKQLTVFGYYTSQIGFEQELQERVIPGAYDPCRMLEAATRGGGA